MPRVKMIAPGRTSTATGGYVRESVTLVMWSPCPTPAAAAAPGYLLEIQIWGLQTYEIRLSQVVEAQPTNLCFHQKLMRLKYQND